MKIGMIGLGKMGYNLSLNFRDNGIEMVAFDIDKERINKIGKEGIETAEDIENLVRRLPEKKVIWIMVPSGRTVDVILEELLSLLSPGDILIDGGNSHYRDSIRRAVLAGGLNINYVDVGTSGGIEGARNGACFMVGAEKEAYAYIEPLLKSAAQEGGYLYCGPSGSGHYLKMIHNGIEYGMMQSIGEGFQLLEQGPFTFDYAEVASVWSKGSVIRGWLMELAEKLFLEHHDLKDLRAVVDSSGEGLWTVEEALKLKVPVPAISSALYSRFSSETAEAFSNKVVAGLREQFGGHQVYKKTEGKNE